MSNQGSTSPYREEDTEARERLDAEHEAEQREELKEQEKLRELSRHALAKTPDRQDRPFGIGAAAGIGLAAGATLGSVGWWVMDDWFVLLASTIIGFLIAMVVFGLLRKPEFELPRLPEKLSSGWHPPN